MLIQILFYIYCAGIVGVALYECKMFAENIKKLQRTSSFIFLVLEVMKKISVGFLWPIVGILFIIQMPFAKGALDEMNSLLSDYNGYPDDED